MRHKFWPLVLIFLYLNREHVGKLRPRWDDGGESPAVGAGERFLSGPVHAVCSQWHHHLLHAAGGNLLPLGHGYELIHALYITVTFIASVVFPDVTRLVWSGHDLSYLVLSDSHWAQQERMWTLCKQSDSVSRSAAVSGHDLRAITWIELLEKTLVFALNIRAGRYNTYIS